MHYETDMFSTDVSFFPHVIKLLETNDCVHTVRHVNNWISFLACNLNKFPYFDTPIGVIHSTEWDEDKQNYKLFYTNAGTSIQTDKFIYLDPCFYNISSKMPYYSYEYILRTIADSRILDHYRYMSCLADLKYKSAYMTDYGWEMPISWPHDSRFGPSNAWKPY